MYELAHIRYTEKKGCYLKFLTIGHILTYSLYEERALEMERYVQVRRKAKGNTKINPQIEYKSLVRSCLILPS